MANYFVLNKFHHPDIRYLPEYNCEKYSWTVSGDELSFVYKINIKNISDIEKIIFKNISIPLIRIFLGIRKTQMKIQVYNSNLSLIYSSSYFPEGSTFLEFYYLNLI
ncbi:MAG: hypothetical protein HeimC3_39550 [Candidatus Heimdallarchaeota archaeon LC_3]|nr:MAG: hypothetical protein HeimC3_39550 [Candidatus Heimdallarchaeota archaeon LC_3]